MYLEFNKLYLSRDDLYWKVVAKQKGLPYKVLVKNKNKKALPQYRRYTIDGHYGLPIGNKRCHTNINKQIIMEL